MLSLAAKVVEVTLTVLFSVLAENVSQASTHKAVMGCPNYGLAVDVIGGKPTISAVIKIAS